MLAGRCCCSKAVHGQHKLNPVQPDCAVEAMRTRTGRQQCSSGNKGRLIILADVKYPSQNLNETIIYGIGRKVKL